METHLREAEWKLYLTLHVSLRWNFEKLTRSWKCPVLALDSRQPNHSDPCRLAQQGRTPSGYWDSVSILRQQAGLMLPSAGDTGWALGDSSPAAPINHLAKGSKSVLAGRVPGGVDAPSCCCAGRQDSWPSVQSDARLDANALCCRGTSWMGSEVVVTAYPEWRISEFCFGCGGIWGAGILPDQSNQICCGAL